MEHGYAEKESRDVPPFHPVTDISTMPNTWRFKVGRGFSYALEHGRFSDQMIEFHPVLPGARCRCRK